ncbi:MAG: hypothetical protein N2Z60_05865 [Elusimicrobiales bacterium]|nr:hypothetical protein [Elusimicrobiales bacterium]HOJ85448.1 hypothetical protein [Elusimicrobiales bacterium]HOL63364.1 hypothetical protein [Elusimicrobiales bacterium]HPO94435.1 hypothetical protein [Elusimicrobiales bacterium]
MTLKGVTNAIKIKHNRLKSFSFDLRNYEFLYTGSEFCENLLEVYLDTIDILKKFDNKICFLTPPVSYKGIDLSFKIFRWLKDNKKNDEIEITVNDFGTINVAREVFGKKIKINLGRHITKHFFSTDKTSIRANSLDCLVFANKMNIKRFEISSFDTVPSHNFDIFKKKRVGFVFSVFYPYVNLTMSRNCLLGMPDNFPSSTIKSIPCLKECINGDYYVTNNKTKTDLIASENSLFVKNVSDIFLSGKVFKSIRADRAVYCPFL